MNAVNAVQDGDTIPTILNVQVRALDLVDHTGVHIGRRGVLRRGADKVPCGGGGDDGGGGDGGGGGGGDGGGRRR